jgi:lipopolysaccharide transport system permease protein
MDTMIQESIVEVGVDPHLPSPGGEPSARHPAVTLPEKPLVIIKPQQSWVGLDLSHVWAYRELLYFLIWRDVKVRYKQTVLGVAWVILQPIITTLIFTIFLGKLARIPSDNIPYPLFAYTGLLGWSFFSGAVMNTGTSLVSNANLITKVYFPRMIIPGAAIGARLVDLAIGFVMLAGMMLYYGQTPTWRIVFLPLPVALLTLLSLGIGMWMSALNVKYRDIGAILPTVIQLWMYVSPVVYPLSLVPARWRWLYILNPLTGIIKAVRSSVLGQALDWPSLAASTVITLAVLVYSAFTFRRMEKQFADVV